MALNEERRSFSYGQFSQRPDLNTVVNPMAQLEHLLKVASSVTRDADQTWAEIWNELKTFTAQGAELPEGFVPAKGWRDFLEKFWLLKHYLDSIHRICNPPPGGGRNT